MPSENQPVDYDGELSGAYEPGRSISPAAKQTWRAAVQPYLPVNETIVDVGAGTGRFARLLAGLVDGPVAAVEPAAGMRDVAAQVSDHPSVHWLGGTAEDLPLAASCASVIWSAFATHYFDLRAAGREFRRVLKPDGAVLVWHAFEDVWDQLEWYRWFPAARYADEERMPTFDHVVSAFDEAGLGLVARTTHSMLIAENHAQLAERLSHRAISSLRLISDGDFASGLANLRAFAESNQPAAVYSPNVLAVFRPF